MNKRQTTPLKVAHRGASDTCPENTILAFNTAWKNDADICEGDFHLTKDKKIVCIHDDNTLRVSGEKMIISESNYEDLLNLNVANYFDGELNEKIPTLEQVLDTVPGAGSFLIEIKSGVEIVPELMNILATTELTKLQIGVISFDKDVLRQVKEIDEQTITLLLNDVGDNMSDAEIKDVLLEIGANGLLTNSYDSEMKDEIESLKMIYNIWSSDPEYTMSGF
jgi:glycerophosphoryl diester phosphodiesterase